MTMHVLRASPETVRIGVFNAVFPPVMTIESGDTVEMQCVVRPRIGDAAGECAVHHSA